MAGRKSYWGTRIEPRLKEIAAWCRDGYTDKLICEALGISVDTFCKYKLLKPELAEALKVNKAIADLTVENSLYMRANGYKYKEVVKEIRTDANGNIIAKHAKETEKTVLPDVTGQIFWLKNRQPGKWRDRQQLEHTGPDGQPISIITTETDPKEAAKIYAQMLKDSSK